MAVVFSTSCADRRYEVRRAGASIRLYTNGVFHSQFNPNRRRPGGIWDLLCLPAQLARGRAVREVLVLGVGGGAVIRMLETMLPDARFTGVELDPRHIEIAWRYFGLDPARTRLVQADARQWVDNNRQPRFDLIIDDVFADVRGQPVRAIPADVSWLRALDRLLTPAGTLAINFASSREYRGSGLRQWVSARGTHSSAYTLGHGLLDNIVAVLPGDPASALPGMQDIQAVCGRQISRRFTLKPIPRGRRG